MPHVERLEQIATVESALSIIPIRLCVLLCHLQSWEARREDDASSLPLDLWHLPISNQSETTLADLFDRRQRDTCISEGEQTCGNGQLSADVPGDDGFWIDAEFFSEVKRPLQPSQLRHIAKDRGLVHVHRTVSPFDEADDVLVEQALLVFIGNFTETCFPTHEFLKGVL